MGKLKGERKRIYEISVFNVILCMLVVFIHVSSTPVSSYNPASLQYAFVLIPWRLAAFVVQGFVFLGGLRLFLGNKERIDYGVYYLSKLKRVVIPYLLWVLIYYAYFLLKGYFTFDAGSLLKHIAAGDLVSHLYFVIIIIQFYILAPLWFAMVKKARPLPVIIVSLVIMVISGMFLPKIIYMLFPGAVFRFNDRLFTTYLLYWVAGCFAGMNYESFKNLLNKHGKLLFIAFTLFMVLDGTITYHSFSNNIYLRWLEYIHIAYCMTAVLFFFSVSTKLKEGSGRFVILIKQIDKSAYYIYLSHVMLIFLADDFLKLAGISSITMGYAFRITVVYTVAIGSAVLIQKIKSMKTRI
ncbi:MAG: acyltransferase [Clostridia bacterium]|nr:acyltransferase [Clostridia bacterium]